MKNKKGFTLIELLAVIVILGVILAIAIPAMTGYINNSKKDSMVSSASQYIDAANKYATTNDMLPTINTKVYIKVNDLVIQKGGTSPYTKTNYWNRPTSSSENGNAAITIASLPTESYVLIENINDNYKYSIYLTDGLNCVSATEEELNGTAKAKRALVSTEANYATCQTKPVVTAMKGKDANNVDVIAAIRVQ